MPKEKKKKQKKNEYKLNAQADVPDGRDYLYEPALLRLAKEMPPPPPSDLRILDQGQEGACTGFALAATINQLNQRRETPVPVSARMLYEMAKIHDEWPGEDYDGSSLRGAIGGWKNMGVCSDEKWPYDAGDPGMLTIDAAKNARETTVGAYYRLRPEISHFHSALNEVGVIAASARVHSGWDRPVNGKIRFNKGDTGGHAFALVGYNAEGFWVQNSWNTAWGANGLALWTYEDWIQNVMDAWVVRLALPTPQIFGMSPMSAKVFAKKEEQAKARPTTPRSEIAGHFIHIDDGKYHDTGRYWSKPEDIDQTAGFIADKKNYPHFLVYAHGGLNSPKASAARIAAMKEGFKRNGIYPFHLMYDTGLVEELKDLVLNKGKASSERAGGAVSDVWDRMLEGLLRRPGTLIWDEMKQDAEDAFARTGAGTDALKRFIKHFRRAAKKGIRKKIHLVGHSTGAIVIAHLLRALQNTDVTISSCSLMAPAATVDLYNSHFLPVVKGQKKLKIGKLGVYNLVDGVERDDTVAVYRKSLLYLVSNSFEGKRKRPLMGMQNFQRQVTKASGKPAFHLSNGISGNTTRSDSHGGFDNDPVTMNHILQSVLNKKPSQPFTAKELEY